MTSAYGHREKPRRRFGFGTLLLVVIALAAALYAWRTYAPETIPMQLAPVLAPERPPPPPEPVLYKWRDDEGRWNITDQPPEGRPYEAVKVDPNTNVLPTGVAPEPLPQ